MNTHDTIELPEYDCLYESTNAQGYIDLEPAYRKSTVLRLLEADRKQRFENGEALKRYKECGADEEQDPIERLRFFCSLAMSGQDWLDSEKFFDDLIADRKHYQETIEALEKEIDSLAFNDSGLLAENKKLKTELMRRSISNECEPAAYHPCTSILIDGLKCLPGGSAILAEWDKARSKVDAPQPAEPVKNTCKKCNGTGVESTRFHGVWPNGEECLESIKCDQCDGFGTTSAAEPVKRKRPYAQGTALGEYGIIPMCDQADDEPVKVPSDAEIGQILKEVLHNSPYGVHQWELWLEFASALFNRYGQHAQPAKSSLSVS